MNIKKPLLVVLTPVLNEAWILNAFLRATSLWADYIIIADQMSTDGSREIYKQFIGQEHGSKLVVIDNPRKEMHQAATRRLLFDAAQKIEGDKVLFALDADEFLSGDFIHTRGWQTILNSEPGDVFFFRWMNLIPDGSQYSLTTPLYWAAHINDDVLNGTFPDLMIHEWRLPLPLHENHRYYIEDIRFIHFGDVNLVRVKNKQLFYQVMQFPKSKTKQTGVGIYRQYHRTSLSSQSYVTPINAYDFYLQHGLDIWANIDVNVESPHHVETIKRILQEVGPQALRKLDIWDDEFLSKYNVTDPRRPIDKLMHWYLRKTNKWSSTILVRAADHILKRFY